MNTRFAHRSKKGNMLVLVCVMMSLAALGILVGLSFTGLFLAQSIMQNLAGSTALSAACILNGGENQEQANGINSSDRIGQMNNMIARARSAVFESSENVQDSASMSQLAGLADQLHNTARDGAMSLEPERRNLKKVMEDEARTEIAKEVAKFHGFRLVLPWIQLSAPRLLPGTSGIAFGQIKGVQSNVMQLDPSNRVTQFDSALIHTNKRYKANKNASLPTDGGIDFYFSSLQPPVKHEVAPSRLVLADEFQPLPNGDGPNGDLPSAVMITMEMDVQTQLGCTSKNHIRVTAVATTTGGAEMR